MTQHEHVGGGTSSSSSSVAVVAIVVLVILAIVAVLAFGGLAWLQDFGGGDRVNPTAQPEPDIIPTLPAPASYLSPAGALAALG